ncbi:Ubiquitin-like-specific protease ESD4 [Striga hermonthica]|uniref:Ubiquitin-like-specific protease ESD4 n=1 Tax=Striga hermonthica TaxID=68872 RepID=A0A9N7MWX3_STRHE|nr:Ubiquitin-like-specific protease ESD4 [Striga hermonthica]
MGALPNSRKRGDDYYNSLVSPSAPIEQSYFRTAKKLKHSPIPAQRTQGNSCSQPPNSMASRIAKYPDRKPGFLREVHAPVRKLRFGFFSLGKKSETAGSFNDSPEMGISGSVYRRCAEAGRTVINRSLKYVNAWKETKKEVIVVDSEDEDRDDVIDDVELKIVDSVGSKRKTRQKDVENSQKPNLKMVENEVRSLDSSVITDASNAVMGVEDGDKVDYMQLGRGSDDSGLPWYKRLLDGLRKKFDGKLGSLKSEIDMHEQRRRWDQLLWPQKKEEQIKKDVAKECFVPLTEKEESDVSYALSNSNRRKILVTHQNSNIDITGEKLQCLKPRAWLNDEVINLYLELLKEREKREPEKFLKCHFFNTFFYKKLISGGGGYNFQSVRRWTTQRKLGYNLLQCDKIFVPIHQEVHWCLAIINKKDKKFQYLDSLRGVDSQVLNVLARYFVAEVKEKCGKDIDVSSWENEYVTDLPEQANGFDCGMFMIKYADFYSRDIGLCFSQEHMPYFRRRTAKEILNLRAE